MAIKSIETAKILPKVAQKVVTLKNQFETISKQLLNCFFNNFTFRLDIRTGFQTGSKQVLNQFLVRYEKQPKNQPSRRSQNLVAKQLKKQPKLQKIDKSGSTFNDCSFPSPPVKFHHSKIFQLNFDSYFQLLRFCCLIWPLDKHCSNFTVPTYV